ncbi:hypothetical protein JNW88_26420, partial [Micromonospora sp. ATA32]|nr:hypothetical protein [Micromonospora sp. ATA32]
VASGNQPNIRTALRYSSRTNTPAILRHCRETAAHTLCDEFWHGTGLHPLDVERPAGNAAYDIFAVGDTPISFAKATVKQKLAGRRDVDLGCVGITG